MDYIFKRSLSRGPVTKVAVSYDIACQWSIHFWDRMLTYDHKWNLGNREFVFFIPKFHISAHRAECNLNFSFNLAKWVGRTDGEAVERGWAAVNPFASSTKEMGPGSRHDFLDDVFGDYNWQKVTNLGMI